MRMPGQTPEKGQGKHRKMWDLGEYQKGRIRASTGNVEIRASTRKGRNPGEYRK